MSKYAQSQPQVVRQDGDASPPIISESEVLIDHLRVAVHGQQRIALCLLGAAASAFAAWNLPLRTCPVAAKICIGSMGTVSFSFLIKAATHLVDVWAVSSSCNAILNKPVGVDPQQAYESAHRRVLSTIPWQRSIIKAQKFLGLAAYPFYLWWLSC